MQSTEELAGNLLGTPAPLPHVTKINRMLQAIEGHWVTIRDLAQEELNRLGNT